ncbi:MAG: tRNA threonylcarbamoyladenosine dehydratase [Chitinispirillia bacterium]|nr:tRNA threonylcarbamoyladenosine dehydratase [Chitinispirillia bacterium]MCL2241155.1 tRNA threonylcarbamoyladenosine dehydratase [Chitinispirillia bacterium]
MNDQSPEHPFTRLEMLVGSECLKALADAAVILFGVGGVGSWCAEALVRSGICRLTIVDSDDVAVTNINRQLPATSATVGRPKVEVMGERLREISPGAQIVTRQRKYSWEVKDEFDLGAYDYVIDAIDSLSSKVELIINASAAGVTLFSALGAACKIDPGMIKTTSIWKTDRCKLGRFVRKRLRRRGFDGDFLCVWSGEESYVPTNKSVNGSLVHVTGVFGFTLAGLVVQDIIAKTP